MLSSYPLDEGASRFHFPVFSLHWVLQKGQAQPPKRAAAGVGKTSPIAAGTALISVTKSLPFSCKLHLSRRNSFGREGDDLRNGLSLKRMKGDLSIWLTIAGDTPRSLAAACKCREKLQWARLFVCHCWAESSAVKTTFNALLRARWYFYKGSHSHTGWRNLPVWLWGYWIQGNACGSGHDGIFWYFSAIFCTDAFHLAVENFIANTL